MRFPFAVALIFTVIPMGASAQTAGSSDSAAQAAEKAYTSENWTDAKRQYSELTKQQPENARFWYRLGVSARGDRHFDASLEALQKAKSLGVGRGLPAFLADYE